MTSNTKSEKLTKYGKICSQLRDLHKEISLLSQKKPDNPINTFKLKFINEKLIEANAILDDKHKPFDEFETFDEANLPSSSDVVLVLSQYVNCMERWFSDNRPKSDLERITSSQWGLDEE